MVTCCSGEVEDHLFMSAGWIGKGALGWMEAAALTDLGVSHDLHVFPQLASLPQVGQTREMVRWPLMLDIVTLPEVTLPLDSPPPIMAGIWLMEWRRREIIRLAGERCDDRGRSSAREQLIPNLARDGGGYWRAHRASSSRRSAALDGVVSDRGLVLEDGAVRFAHNMFEDWALAHALASERTELGEHLIKSGVQFRLVHPLRLLALRDLEVKGKLQGRESLLDQSRSIANTVTAFPQLAGGPALNENQR